MTSPFEFDDTEYDVAAPTGEHLFRARLTHVGTILRLRDDALNRVFLAAATQPQTIVYMNGRNTPWHEDEYIISLVTR